MPRTKLGSHRRRPTLRRGSRETAWFSYRALTPTLSGGGDTATDLRLGPRVTKPLGPPRPLQCLVRPHSLGWPRAGHDTGRYAARSLARHHPWSLLHGVTSSRLPGGTGNGPGSMPCPGLRSRAGLPYPYRCCPRRRKSEAQTIRFPCAHPLTALGGCLTGHEGTVMSGARGPAHLRRLTPALWDADDLLDAG